MKEISYISEKPNRPQLPSLRGYYNLAGVVIPVRKVRI